MRAPASSFTIRDFGAPDDYRACLALQREIWGAAFVDAVPPSILTVQQRVGGVAAGGFAPDGRLLGFVFGMAGLVHGHPILWSDMLAVRPDARGTGLARALKAHQRERAREHGMDAVYWTYEPLVARNAHLNFNVFGAAFVEYVRDMYPESGSDLHVGIGTDRFVVHASTGDTELARRLNANREAVLDPALASAPLVTPDAPLPGDWRTHPGIRVGIPADVEHLQGTAPDAALAWRQSTREAIHALTAAGFRLVGFDPARAAGTPAYLFARGA